MTMPIDQQAAHTIFERWRQNKVPLHCGISSHASGRDGVATVIARCYVEWIDGKTIMLTGENSATPVMACIPLTAVSYDVSRGQDTNDQHDQVQAETDSMHLSAWWLGLHLLLRELGPVTGQEKA